MVGGLPPDAYAMQRAVKPVTRPPCGDLTAFPVHRCSSTPTPLTSDFFDTSLGGWWFFFFRGVFNRDVLGACRGIYSTTVSLIAFSGSWRATAPKTQPLVRWLAGRAMMATETDICSPTLCFRGVTNRGFSFGQRSSLRCVPPRQPPCNTTTQRSGEASISTISRHLVWFCSTRQVPTVASVTINCIAFSIILAHINNSGLGLDFLTSGCFSRPHEQGGP